MDGDFVIGIGRFEFHFEPTGVDPLFGLIVVESAPRRIDCQTTPFVAFVCKQSIRAFELRELQGEPAPFVGNIRIGQVTKCGVELQGAGVDFGHREVNPCIELLLVHRDGMLRIEGERQRPFGVDQRSDLRIWQEKFGRVDDIGGHFVNVVAEQKPPGGDGEIFRQDETVFEPVRFLAQIGIERQSLRSAIDPLGDGG